LFPKSATPGPPPRLGVVWVVHVTPSDAEATLVTLVNEDKDEIRIASYAAIVVVEDVVAIVADESP
jgi:hypothetical protein